MDRVQQSNAELLNLCDSDTDSVKETQSHSADKEFMEEELNMTTMVSDDILDSDVEP